MNRDEKAAVIDQVAAEIQQSEAIFAIDYRGISVKQAKELRGALTDAGASLRVVKNTLTERAADKAGAESLKPLLIGPTALAFVSGDAATAAKAIATFRRQAGLLEFKGGRLSGETLSVDQIEEIARLPSRDVLRGQFVGVLASPITGLVRGLGSLISGLAVALGEIQEKGLVSGTATPAAAEGGSETAAAPAEPASESGTEGAPPERAVDAVPEVPSAEQERTSPAPEEGGDKSESQES